MTPRPLLVGTVEVLATRNYPLDAMVPGTESRTEVAVDPGEFPLYRFGISYFWMMHGRLNEGGVRRQGDGMFIATAGDVPVDIEVVFPSPRFGPDEFTELMSHPVATEGHADQRLRISLLGEDPSPILT